MNNSVYESPETKPFASFANDMCEEQRNSHNDFTTQLMNGNTGLDISNVLAHKLGRALRYGAYLAEKYEHDEYWIRGYSIPPYNCENASDRMGVWFDWEKRVFCVLEWNKVKGVVVRNYAPMTFIKKFLKTYVLHGNGENAITVDDFAKYIDLILPNMKNMTVEVWDTPSEMYDHTNIDSCMVGTEYVKFYDTAPVKGLVVMNDGKLVTRTLLWTLDDGRRAIGRIYDSTGGGKVAIKKWCEENDVLTEIPYDAKVTAPISEYGVPYQDDLYTGVRVKNNLVMFPNNRYAREYAGNNNGERFDLCSTTGNDVELRQLMVETSDGSYCLERYAINHNGVVYNYLTLKDVTPYNFYRMNLNDIVRHPTKANEVIEFSALGLYDGQVYPTDEMVEVDGKMEHESCVFGVVVEQDDSFTVKPIRVDADFSDLCNVYYYISGTEMQSLKTIIGDRYGSRLYASYVTIPKLREFLGGTK